MEQEIHQGEEYTTSCWGKCFSCGLYGHKAAQCRGNADGKELSGAGGAIKKAGAGSGVEAHQGSQAKTKKHNEES